MTRDKKGQTPLHRAAARGQVHTTNILCRRGGRDCVDNKGWTPLHHAAHGGWEKTTEALLRNSANINAQTKDGSTATHLAVQSRKFNTAQTLCEYHANLSQTDNNKRKPMYYAVMGGSMGLVLLLERHRT